MRQKVYRILAADDDPTTRLLMGAALGGGRFEVTVVADEPYFYIDSFFYYQDCDLYYYLDRDNDRRGGYAPLKNSQQYQIREASEINSRYLVHLHGEIVYMDVDERYELVERIEMDKQFADIYKLSIQQNN